MAGIPLISIGRDSDGVELFAPAHLRPSASAPRLLTFQPRKSSYDLRVSLGAFCLLALAMVARAYLLGA